MTVAPEGPVICRGRNTGRNGNHKKATDWRLTVLDALTQMGVGIAQYYVTVLFKFSFLGAGEMAQWLTALGALARD